MRPRSPRELGSIGSIAELSAAFAVVVSILYLEKQLKQARAELVADSRDHNFHNFSSAVDPIIQDPELAKLWVDGIEGGNLNREDSLRFRLLLSKRFRYMQLLFLRAIEVDDVGALNSVKALVQDITKHKAALEFLRASGFRQELKDFVEQVILESAKHEVEVHYVPFGHFAGQPEASHKLRMQFGRRSRLPLNRVLVSV